MYLTKVNRKMTREGLLWFGINRRCKKGGDFQEKQPCYVGCSMSENFKNFQWFAEWCNNQIGFNSLDENGRVFNLDKDIVSDCNNKVYGETTCVFVPAALNLFFTDRSRKQGLCLPGVCWHTRDLVYTSQCNNGNGKIIHIGNFKNEMDAHIAYKAFKESLAKQLAIKWVGLVDDRVVESLNNFKVLTKTQHVSVKVN